MSSEANQDASVGPRAIGGLLRLAWQAHRDRLYERVTAAGFEDITPAQFELVRWHGMDGRRPTELADAVGLSKQTVNDLLGELERNGYIERHDHPDDGRARVVRLTERGWRLQRTSHAASRGLEDAWAATVGTRRHQSLRSTLELMLERDLMKE